MLLSWQTFNKNERVKKKPAALASARTREKLPRSRGVSEFTLLAEPVLSSDSWNGYTAAAVAAARRRPRRRGVRFFLLLFITVVAGCMRPSLRRFSCVIRVYARTRTYLHT